jgi:hypothetical protein
MLLVNSFLTVLAAMGVPCVHESSYPIQACQKPKNNAGKGIQSAHEHMQRIRDQKGPRLVLLERDTFSGSGFASSGMDLGLGV